jgi:hypothetical protein
MHSAAALSLWFLAHAVQVLVVASVHVTEAQLSFGLQALQGPALSDHPALQAEQVVEPSDDCCASHGVQTPSARPYPTLQAEHFASVAEVQVVMVLQPEGALHAVQVAAPAAEKNPASQAVQAAVPSDFV